jgi:DNA processing protein
MTIAQGLSETDFVAWVGLCLVPRIGGVTLKALLAHFGTLANILAAEEADLCRVKRIGATLARQICALDLSLVARKIELWQAESLHLLTWHSSAYPQPLLALDDAPPLLFVRGNPAQTWTRWLAIVGTRQPDPDSAQVARNLAAFATARGWGIVSGLALGIDTAAHHGGLARTVAFLGCGVDVVYPPSNASLVAQMLAASGALYAEVPPRSLVSAGGLMARNRLIAGLASALCVIQAEQACGSLAAARRAAQLGKPVYTLDQPSYAGNQSLLAGGAGRLPTNPDAWESWLAGLLSDRPANGQQDVES